MIPITFIKSCLLDATDVQQVFAELAKGYDVHASTIKSIQKTIEHCRKGNKVLLFP